MIRGTDQGLGAAQPWHINARSGRFRTALALCVATNCRSACGRTACYPLSVKVRASFAKDPAPRPSPFRERASVAFMP